MSAFTKSEAQPSSPTVPGSAHAVCFFVLCKRHWINSGPKLSRFKFQVQALLSYSLANLNFIELEVQSSSSSSKLLSPCVSLFYVNDTGSIGSRGRTVGIPYIYPPP